MLNHFNEPDALRGVAQGDATAFKAIYDRYAGAVYQAAYRYLRSSKLAEDIVQEVFLTIWEKKNFTSVYHFRFYLHAIAKNLCLRYFKNLDHETRASKEFSYDRGMSDNSRERYDYLLHLESMELHIGDAIEKLPPQRKQIFELVNVGGLSYDDIAGKLNISQETVRTQVKRALRNIRHHLEVQNGSALLYPTGAFLITLLE